jgi:undecaprenyl-phosphate 4-deoxy-4-formamido-L-arabinose transferase
VVIPVYNAEKSIERLISQLYIDLKGIDFEVVLVNDGSRDNSEKICSGLAEANPSVKFISLRKNFGEHNAVLCGLNFVEGEYAVIIDDDFQNPPSEIAKLLTEIEHGYDVVYSKYHQKRHNIFRNCCSSIHNSISNFLIDKPSDLYLSSFKIISKEVVDEIVKYKGPFPYIDGLVMRTTDNISSVYVHHAERAEGKSNYTVAKLFSLYMNMFINFSIKPLRIFTLAGTFIFALGLILAIYFISSKFMYWQVPGWTSTILIILLFSGFQIIFLGLIGEYMGKQYLDQNNTPQWVIKKRVTKKRDN